LLPDYRLYGAWGAGSTGQNRDCVDKAGRNSYSWKILTMLSVLGILWQAPNRRCRDLTAPRSQHDLVLDRPPAVLPHQLRSGVPMLGQHARMNGERRPMKIDTVKVDHAPLAQACRSSVRQSSMHTLESISATSRGQCCGALHKQCRVAVHKGRADGHRVPRGHLLIRAEDWIERLFLI